MSEKTGKLVVKAGNGKGFKIEGEEGWFNASDTVVPYLAKLEKGELVTVVYEKKGKALIVSSITTDMSEQTDTSDNAEFKCEVCGVALKDGKFKKCYTCNKSGASKPASKPTETSKKTSYDSPEKVAAIQRGNALNAAAASISGNFPGNEPDVIAQALLQIAKIALDWLREE
ncbi:MAG: hypothetical protein WC055_16610 [Melioribacteraceae bacterium]